ncbi:hypothetical protein ABZX30_27735 [Streptomyces sp. NPDC004542]|uniref:hypothetical protein n=1 Tax=Streptomyces sp. NPDC004542 TaxID=3154281 RepID=UPI0033B3D306
MTERPCTGSYAPPQATPTGEVCASVQHIGFQVRGGLRGHRVRNAIGRRYFGERADTPVTGTRGGPRVVSEEDTA